MNTESSLRQLEIQQLVDDYRAGIISRRLMVNRLLHLSGGLAAAATLWPAFAAQAAQEGTPEGTSAGADNRLHLSVNITPQEALTLVVKLTEDDAFRDRLSSDPEATLAEIGIEVPPGQLNAPIELPSKEELRPLVVDALRTMGIEATPSAALEDQVAMEAIASSGEFAAFAVFIVFIVFI